MAHVINDNCVMCGTCADVCPIGCISEGDGKYVIDADQCVDCGTCALKPYPTTRTRLNGSYGRNTATGSSFYREILRHISPRCMTD